MQYTSKRGYSKVPSLTTELARRYDRSIDAARIIKMVFGVSSGSVRRESCSGRKRLLILPDLTN